MGLAGQGTRAERVDRGRALAIPMLLCVLMAAGCGESDKKATPASRLASPRASAVPPSPSIAGDADGDDEANAAANASDGDNDDSKPTDQDNDSDSNGRSYFDADDSRFRRYGHKASRHDRQAIAALVKRYYERAAAGDGMRGCALMARPLARSLPQSLAGPAGPPYARGVGDACPAVLKATFFHYHRQLALHLRRLSVGEVRLEGSQGKAILAFKGLPGRFIDVAQERGAWKIDAVVDSELP